MLLAKREIPSIAFAGALASAAFALPLSAHAQRSRDPNLPERVRPEVVVGSVLPIDAVTPIRVVGLGGQATIGLVPLEPLVRERASPSVCGTPCRFVLAPGRYNVFVDPGPRQSDRGGVDIPLEGGTLFVDVHDRRPIGSALVVAGLVTAVVGLVATTLAIYDATHPSGFDVQRAGALFPVAIAFDVTSGITLGIGGWLAQAYRTRVESPDR